MSTFTVRPVFKANTRHHFDGGGGRDINAEERLHLVTTQAVLYSLVYLNTFLWPVACTIVRDIVKELPIMWLQDSSRPIFAEIMSRSMRMSFE